MSCFIFNLIFITDNIATSAAEETSNSQNYDHEGFLTIILDCYFVFHSINTDNIYVFLKMRMKRK